MKVIDPGPGELLDRETILEIKVRAAKSRGLPRDHFEEEAKQIRLRLAPFVKHPEWKLWRSRLLRVNQMVWDSIDGIRGARSDAEAARWARQSMHGNDERATIVARVNAATGAANGQEKIP
jgi:hypothetical protein